MLRLENLRWVVLLLAAAAVVVASLARPSASARQAASPAVERALAARARERRERWQKRPSRPLAPPRATAPASPVVPEPEEEPASPDEPPQAASEPSQDPEPRAGAGPERAAPPAPPASVPAPDGAEPPGVAPAPGDPVAHVLAPPAPAAPPDQRPAAEDDGSPIAPGAADLEGFIRQPDGTPVPGLEISLRPADRSLVAATAFSGEGGRYAFLGIPAGRYRLDLGPSETPIAWAPDRLRLDPGRNRYDLRTPRLGDLVVKVRTETGAAPVEGATVFAKEAFGRRWKAVTAGGGTATFHNLPAGDYRVVLMRNRIRVAEARQVIFAHARPEVLLVMPETVPEPLRLEESPARPGVRKRKKKD